jgi:hypothetical protein
LQKNFKNLEAFSSDICDNFSTSGHPLASRGINDIGYYLVKREPNHVRNFPSVTCKINSPLEILRSVGRLVALWKETDLVLRCGRWASRVAAWPPPPFTWPSAIGACHGSGSLASAGLAATASAGCDPYSGAARLLRRRRQHHLALARSDHGARRPGGRPPSPLIRGARRSCRLSAPNCAFEIRRTMLLSAANPEICA